jgi:hypothetical protein
VLPHGLDPTDFARNYDPSTSVIGGFGHTVDLRAVIAEARPIVDRVRVAQKQRYVERFGH